MGKLIYLYIKDIKRNIKKQELKFSNEFKIDFNDGNLSISRVADKEKFWGEKIENLTLLIGKNGVGKSSVMDLIGSNEKTKNHIFNKPDYFLIFHIKDDLFYFEGTMSNEIKNIDKINNNRRHFHFKINRDGDINIVLPTERNRINIYYSRNKLTIPWAGQKKIYKENTSKTINYYEKNATFEDAYNTYLQFDLFYNKNRSFRVEQKINYTNHPRYLSFIYEINLQDININSTHNMFLTQEGIKINNSLYKNYVRSKQDNIYNDEANTKLYFILRILEKVLMLNLSWLLEKNEKIINQETKYSVLHKIINIRESYIFKDLEINDSGILNVKIQYLKQVLKYITIKFKNLSMKVKLHEVENFVSLLESIPNDYYKDKNYILIPSEEHGLSKTVKHLKLIYSNIFNFKFTDFSDGELVYLNLFATINKYITDSKDEDCILLLDEPDINLHPEWSRKLVFDLLRLIKARKENGNVQIVIATHSPFIATDFPKENIFAFKNENSNKEVSNYVISNPEFGFAANIYDLITDTFFMNASIGEFAISKIREIQDLDNAMIANQVVEKIDDIFLKNKMEKELNKYDKNQ